MGCFIWLYVYAGKFSMEESRRATQNTSQEKEMKTRIELKEIKKETEDMKKKKNKAQTKRWCGEKMATRNNQPSIAAGNQQ